MNKTERLKESVSLLPEEPGVYRFYNSEDVVIYVGKAKNLKKRVSSYFLAKNASERKVMALVKNIDRIEHIVVQSESDALLLENNMIKNLQPKYNILLKDDKTYPWIMIKNEAYPRIIGTRIIEKNGSKYFGPYTSVTMQRVILDLVRKLYFIRTCSLPLTKGGVVANKYQKCLEYHIGNCKAPCEDQVSCLSYNEGVKMAEEILKGDMTNAQKYLRQEMARAAEALRFEEAQQYKIRLEMLDKYASKSVIVSPQYSDLDVFSLVVDDYTAYCNYLHIKGGAVINSFSIEMKLRLEESEVDILTYAIINIMSKLERELSREVIVPFLPDVSCFDGINFTVPQRGDKVKLLELSEKNSKFHRLERLKQIEKRNPETATERLMEKMRKDLSLKEQPTHIECFDNSNIQGKFPVSACVVFRDGKPAKRDYRHYNIKTVEGIDDFASMRETVLRRYSRLLEEGTSLPQLIVIDGGKGQLSFAYSVLTELGLEDKIKIVGLAKRFEEIYFPNDPDPLCLDKTGETLKVLMHIRDEAHRFGITFHRNKRSKGFIHTELEDIEGVGKLSIKKLLTHFKSINKIKSANFEQVSAIVGEKRARDIINHFNNGK